MDTFSLTDPWALFAVAAAMALGGVLKGATGAGLPVISVPVIASIYDVRVAVAVMVIPNLISNLGQVRKYRNHALDRTFARNLALSGAAGAGVGTLFLAWLPLGAMHLTMAGIILAYIALRLLRYGLRLPLEAARKWVWVAGVVGGTMQGAVGISAPVAVTFLNAMALPRPTFILTVSVFFATMCVAQIPVQLYYGIMTPATVLLGLFALLPLAAALPAGEWIGRRFSAALFDRIILIFLGALAVRLILSEIF